MTAGARRILVWVQNLLGTGHVRRAGTVAQALARAGFSVRLATGDTFGTPVPAGIAVERLLPVRARDATFADLVGADGAALPGDWLARRTAQVHALVRDWQPDAALVELYPFGRRAFRAEMAGLLDAMGDRPVFCSIRDILAQKRKPERVAETVALVRQRFAGVLVHSDAAIVPLGATFPAADAIADKVHYTGYVLDRSRLPAPRAGDEVLVAAGGAEGGADLLQAALAARNAGLLPERPWRLLVPPALGPALLAELKAGAPERVAVEPTRPDFPDLLARAGLVIARAGYNTVLECVALGRRTVCVPFAAGDETEQTVRADLFAKAGLVTDARIETLAAACTAALAAPPPMARIALDGAPNAARLLREALA
ncbi:glycosyltransferase family protein [Zavarzinia sp. CC-PAN008]|uniref:glycosyltransferase family protein n=1 Tax=Zavarzinia sp. CC-PAN008 TaxID=3243332 RepID=UPI003F7428BA